jgi:MoaA/NifB/PqqE/SkfB family radical SAM enzyme
MSDKPGMITIASRLMNGWFSVNVLGRKVPLLTAWNLTFHCNLRCHYCACPHLHVPELKTPEILEAINEFHRRGMRWVTFSGGEPLLRKDIGTIVDHCKDLGIITFLSTNGTLLPRRIESLKRLDKVTISLDGAEQVHDAIRGQGSFAEAAHAVALAQEYGITVGLTCVISSHNIDTLEDVLVLAERMGVACMFQPATQWLNSHTDPNPIAPEPGPYRDAVRRLIALKRKGAPIANSMPGLKYLLEWPEPRRIWSTAGRLTCTVESDGKVLSSHITQTAGLEDPITDSLTPWERFDALDIPRYNDQSWCGPILELDLLFALHPGALWNTFKVHGLKRTRKHDGAPIAAVAEPGPITKGAP